MSECLDRLAANKGQGRPGSTYRLQFHRGFRFADAQRLVPYLQALGMTHCYASPILKAREGSMHGYDITDHRSLNPEVGTEEDFRGFAAELRRAGLGLVLDLVPNHMGVGHGTNPWWQDVLENGQASRYAAFFDIDWDPLKDDMAGKVLLPILGGQYGEELEQGRVALHFEAGEFFCQYYDKRLPVDPQTIPLLFETVSDLRSRCSELEWPHSGLQELEVLLGELRSMPRHNTPDSERVQLRQQRLPWLRTRLAELGRRSPAVRGVFDEAVRIANGQPGKPRTFDTLHQLLEAQAYRLAHWRVSAEEINYRRFFDVNDLVGLRMENPEVFAATHRLIRRLLADGSVDGLRIDHPDGLLNPIQYLVRLQILYAAAHCCGPEPDGRLAENGIEEPVVSIFSQHEWLNREPPLYVLVEKILERGESLAMDWPVAGTVGYEFGALLNGIFIDTRNKKAFTNFYHRFLGEPLDPDEVIYEAKRSIMKSSLSSEITVLSHRMVEISSTDRRARDFTRHALTEAIRETIASFPVYRTYIDERGNISERDRMYIQQAIAAAKRRNPDSPTATYDLLRDILLLKMGESRVSAENYRKRLYFTLKFQQLTGPVMAKGLEDTACYVYNRFVSVNEVGSSPKEFGVSVDEFHEGNLERQRDWPHSMLNTSTHDSKRSEDVRARLNVLSELPTAWSAQALRWRRANRSRKRTISDGRVVPDHNEEYLLYQTLAGAWPFDIDAPGARQKFTERMVQYMTKAVHEAKVNLSWTNQNPEYVAALQQFIHDVLKHGNNGRHNRFLEQLEPFVETVSFFGVFNSLAQVLLKITSPGVPDIYQGQELWDFSLVDPDNRRGVDFELRQKVLNHLLPHAEAPDRARLASEVLSHYRDGRVKMWTTLQALRFRSRAHELFRAGHYIPLRASGAKQEHLAAFARELNWRMAVTVVPRLVYTLMGGKMEAPLGSVWGETELILPGNAPERFENVLTGEIVDCRSGRILCRELFRSFPVALLSGQ